MATTAGNVSLTRKGHMLAEALTTAEEAQAEVVKRRTRANRATTKAMEALAEAAAAWERGEATHQEVRNVVIRAHNDIMRAPSPFAIDQAERRAAAADAMVKKLKGGTDA